MYRNNLRGHDPMIRPSHSNGYLEQENDQLVDNLASKVSSLKSLTIEIGQEVKKQNEFMDTMDSDFENSRGLLGSTMRRLGIVSKSGGHRFMCYLALFAFAVFMIIYYIVKK